MTKTILKLNLIDKFEAQEFAYQAQKMEAIGNVASSLTRGMYNIAEGAGSDAMVKAYTQQQIDANNPLYAGMKDKNLGGARAYGLANLSLYQNP